MDSFTFDPPVMERLDHPDQPVWRGVHEEDGVSRRMVLVDLTGKVEAWLIGRGLLKNRRWRATQTWDDPEAPDFHWVQEVYPDGTRIFKAPSPEEAWRVASAAAAAIRRNPPPERKLTHDEIVLSAAYGIGNEDPRPRRTKHPEISLLLLIELWERHAREVLPETSVLPAIREAAKVEWGNLPKEGQTVEGLRSAWEKHFKAVTGLPVVGGAPVLRTWR